jgi:pantothenate kinase
MVVERSFDQLLEYVRAMVVRPGRSFLGITGPPAAGKSTLAQRLADALAPDAAYVSLDGFHLAQRELERIGKADRKGAPDTFDALGYIALLCRLRNPSEGTVYAPVFHREIEDSIANEHAIHPSIKLVITEGNYLLVPFVPWDRVTRLLDEVWYLELDQDTRIQRLIARHQAYGRNSEAARARATGPDQRNADLITRYRELATIRIKITSLS